ncbi:hypothetical protein [Cytobacillus massiliigabonensis]|uniref:hypothetical protein n=1 Tax=Cytobacillus massiliigabonensis TaxID=1871011 RepID=UPI000C851489|nr:hypothetical protein [Cytobacillus massiliigabonensis]
MRKIFILFAAAITSTGILTACSSDSTDKEEAKPIKVEINNEEEKGEDIQVSGVSKEDNGSSKEENKKEESTATLGNFIDQTDLRIGDTGQTESTIAKYEITLNSVKIKNTIDGKTPSLDHYFLGEITLKNIGETAFDAADIVDNLAFTEDLKFGGDGDFSKLYTEVNPLIGKVEPGQSVTGDILFQGIDSDTYYIRTKKGLLSSGAVKNDTIWSFTKKEIQ